MSRLVLTPRHRVAIERHGASAYPEECCGVLLGSSLEGEGGTLVVQVLPARNDRRESRGNRYVISPEAVMAAMKQARAAGLEVVGFYHSHPDHPAVPSEFDREHAWPNLSYLIVAVEEGRPADLRSWRLQDDRQGFVEEPVEEPAPVLAERKGGLAR